MRYLAILLVVMLAAPFTSTFAQDEEEQGGALALNVIVPDLGDNFRSSDESTLETRMQQMTSNYGIGGTSLNPNFVFVPDVIVKEYSSVGSAPPRKLAKLEVVLKIANAESETLFSTGTIQTSGVGRNKQEALSEAINKLDTRDSKIEDFIKDAKKEIIEYYNQQCDNLIQQAETKANSEQFEQAFQSLYRIPTGADCYDKAMDKVNEVFNQYQKVKCSKLLSSARAAHSAGNMDEAAQNLALIPASSECNEKAKKLAEKIEDERLMKYEDDVEIRKLKVRAARDIALAFAKNQPDKQVDIRFLTTN